MAELKPCPFCGGAARMKITPHIPNEKSTRHNAVMHLVAVELRKSGHTGMLLCMPGTGGLRMANEKRLIDAISLREQMAANFQQALWLGCDDPIYSVAAETIEDAPTVDAVEVVHGRWIYKWDAERDPKKYFIRIVCSECNLHTGQRSNYCPQCGAKMDGDGNG